MIRREIGSWKAVEKEQIDFGRGGHWEREKKEK